MTLWAKWPGEVTTSPCYLQVGAAQARSQSRPHWRPLGISCQTPWLRGDLSFFWGAAHCAQKRGQYRSTPCVVREEASLQEHFMSTRTRQSVPWHWGKKEVKHEPGEYLGQAQSIMTWELSRLQSPYPLVGVWQKSGQVFARL